MMHDAFLHDAALRGLEGLLAALPVDEADPQDEYEINHVANCYGVAAAADFMRCLRERWLGLIAAGERTNGVFFEETLDGGEGDSRLLPDPVCMMLWAYDPRVAEVLSESDARCYVCSVYASRWQGDTYHVIWTRYEDMCEAIADSLAPRAE